MEDQRSQPVAGNRLMFSLTFPVLIAVVLAAAFLINCRAEPLTSSAGPVKVLYTGDVGGKIDPCG